MPYENPIPKLDDSDLNITLEAESDYKEYENMYFAFIDVLGFKKTFDDSKNTSKDNVAMYKEIFNYYFELMNEARFMNRQDSTTTCYAGQTSDSLYFYTDRIDFLFDFVKIYSHFSTYSMTKNIFFRGGISKGKLFRKRSYQFYGDSVIGAYLLESCVSRFPVVSIDSSTYSDMLEISDTKDYIFEDKERHYLKPFAYLTKKPKLDIDNDTILRKIDDETCIEKIINENKKLFEFDVNNFSKYAYLLERYKEEMHIDNSK